MDNPNLDRTITEMLKSSSASFDMMNMTKRDQYFNALDAIDAEEKMRRGDMKPIEAVKYLIDKFNWCTYTAANDAVYMYRVERNLIQR